MASPRYRREAISALVRPSASSRRTSSSRSVRQATCWGSSPAGSPPAAAAELSDEDEDEDDDEDDDDEATAEVDAEYAEEETR